MPSFLSTATLAALLGNIGVQVFADSAVDELFGSPHPFIPHPILDPEGSLTCSDFACEKDHGTDNCEDFPRRICRHYKPCGGTICLHKDLFPMIPVDLPVILVLFVVAILCGMGGIGGGAINLPVLMMLGAFDVKEAVPLSFLAVFGNAFAQNTVNMGQPHPENEKRTLIDYQMTLLLLPSQLAGNALGVVFGRTFPRTVIVILASVVLLLSAGVTCKKGVSLVRERKQAKSNALSQPLVAKAPETNAKNAKSPSKQNVGKHDNHDGTIVSPTRAVAGVAFFSLVFCIIFLFLSPDVSGIQLCSKPYWLALAAMLPVSILSIFIGVREFRNAAAKNAAHGGKIAGEPNMKGATVLLMPLGAATIGLLSGLLGLGGGELLVPLLMTVGMHPRAAPATNGLISVMTTFINVVHYLVAGTLSPFLGYGICCVMSAFVGALIGLRIRDLKAIKDHSYITVFLLAGLLVCSVALLIYRNAAFALDWSFKPMCPA